MLNILNETAEEAEKTLHQLFSQILNDPQTGHFYDWKRSIDVAPESKRKRNNALSAIFIDPFLSLKDNF